MSNTTQAPTDEEIVDVLTTAGVEFMRFAGGISGTRDVWTTSGSQDVKDIANGVRAAIARWGAQPAASPAQVVAREPMSEGFIEMMRPMHVEPAAFAAGIRFAEKHHGIKETPNADT